MRRSARPATRSRCASSQNSTLCEGQLRDSLTFGQLGPGPGLLRAPGAVRKRVHAVSGEREDWGRANREGAEAPCPGLAARTSFWTSPRGRVYLLLLSLADTCGEMSGVQFSEPTERRSLAK